MLQVTTTYYRHMLSVSQPEEPNLTSYPIFLKINTLSERLTQSASCPSWFWGWRSENSPSYWEKNPITICLNDGHILSLSVRCTKILAERVTTFNSSAVRSKHSVGLQGGFLGQLGESHLHSWAGGIEELELGRGYPCSLKQLDGFKPLKCMLGRKQSST